MPQRESVIVDTNWLLDPRLARASGILMGEGKGLLDMRCVNVSVDGIKRGAVEIDLLNEKSVIIEAVRRVGLTILENAEKIAD